MAYPNILYAHKELENRGIKLRRFAWMTPQFTVDETGKAHLLSLNMNGNLLSPIWSGRFPYVDKHFDKPILEHFKEGFKLLGIAGYKRSSYKEELRLASLFSSRKGLKKREREVLREMIDEEQTAIKENCQWERIFPQLDTLNNYIPFFSVMNYGNKTNTHRSGMFNKISWKYLHFRKSVLLESEAELNNSTLSEDVATSLEINKQNTFNDAKDDLI